MLYERFRSFMGSENNRVDTTSMDRARRSPTIPIDWEELAPPWTVDELTVVWAVTPKETQNYNKDAPWVREVAELLVRSPSAVSRKMANLWSVWRPGTGMPHVGKNDRIVVERYRDRPDDLIRDANRIRVRLMERTPSARAEGISPNKSTSPRTVGDALRLEAESAAIDPKALVVYHRAGSDIIGFAIESYQVLEAIGAVALFAEIALRLYPWMSATHALKLAQEKDQNRFARTEVAARLPDLHQEHLSVSDLRQLAARLSISHVEPIRFSMKLARAFRGIDLGTSRARILEVLHIDPKRPCVRCTILLIAATEAVLLADAKSGT